MKPYLIIFGCICSAFAFVNAVPVPASNQELDVLQIPLSNGKELDVLTLGSKDQEQLIAERNKRTIGLLRELFPDITKQIDGIVNRIIAQVIRVAGPDVLRSVLGNNRNITPRPNLAADFDDEDDDNDDGDISKSDINSKTAMTTSSSSNGDNTRVQIDLPTFPPEADATNKVSSSSLADSTSISPSTPETSSITPSSTTTTTSTTTTISPIYIIPPTTTTTTVYPIPTTSTTTTTPSTTTSTTTTTTTSSPIYIIKPTTTPPITNNDPNTPIPEITFNVPNTLTSSMVNSLTNSIQNELNINPEPKTVNESQLMAIVESLNRLLNSTNYFVATRDNFFSSTTSVLSQTTTSTADFIAETTTPKITKLLPNGATDTQIDLSAINKQLEETIRVARQVKEAEAAAQAVAALQQQQPAQLPIPTPKVEETIQLSFNNELTNNDKSKSISNELQLSDSKSPAIDELILDSNEDSADLDDRNKRFLQFGGAGLAGGSSSSSSSGATAGAGTGGSGNFLFDVVRLFSGSVQTQAGDEAANSVNSSSDSDTDSDSNRANDGYTEGIPGPVTRLVVLANRGLANLIQDLILRIAATSEKFVNFKAKLITALI